MCIAILQKAGEELSKETFYQCWRRNPDGAGLMFANHGEIRIYKELDSVDKFYNTYKRVLASEAKGRDMVVHFRIATHGSIVKRNCHPFRINQRIAFAHNGIIHNVSTKRYKDASDTRVFAKEVLSQLPDGFETCQATMRMVEEFIGRSKLILLDNKGNSSIANEHMGEWVGDIWFSNGSHVCSKPVNKSFDKWEANASGTKFTFKDPKKSSKPKNVTKAYKTANTRNIQPDQREFWTAEEIADRRGAEKAKKSAAQPFPRPCLVKRGGR